MLRGSADRSKTELGAAILHPNCSSDDANSKHVIFNVFRSIKKVVWNRFDATYLRLGKTASRKNTDAKPMLPPKI